MRHGHGYTRFARDAHGVALDLLQFVPVDDPIKICPPDSDESFTADRAACR